MENYNGKSMKYLIALLLLIGTFAALIGHAYNYLPKKENDTKIENSVQEDFSRYENNNYRQAEEDTSATKEENNSSYESQNYDNSSEKRRIKYREETAAEKTVNTEPPAENIVEELPNKDITGTENIFANAEQLKAEKKYESAVYEYQKIAKETNDTEIQAQCNEKIALIYAEIKRYGSAIAYAQKAYNTAPNTQRELLLARLYYKTGDIDKATNKVNDILKRDFTDETTK